MFDLQSVVQSGVQSSDCSATHIKHVHTVYHTIGRSIKNMIGVVVNRLVGMVL